jgi:osmotically-inducible protein OsmY
MAEPAGDSAIIAPSDKTAGPDNSSVNTRDRNGENVTAMDQSNRPEDLNLTREIRKAIMSDDSLSMEAKNIKIITLNGAVTLRGPVKTSQEKDTIVAKATEIARNTKVNNELEIAGNK